MKLTNVHIMKYKCIEDSTPVDVKDVTCLVGKNEAGKTAFLHVLQKLNPVKGVDGKFDLLEYPRKELTKYKKIHEKNPATVVIAKFELSDDEVQELESAFCEGILKSKNVKVSKGYNNIVYYGFDVDEKAFVTKILSGANLPQKITVEAQKATTCEELITILESIKKEEGDEEEVGDEGDEEEDIDPLDELLSDLRERFESSLDLQIINDYLSNFIPIFVYFDDYMIMIGKASIEYLQKRRDQEELEDSERTLLSLLALAGTKLEDFITETNYERIKAELEAASISITDEVFEFWTQNKFLEVQFDISQGKRKRSVRLRVIC